MTTPEELQVEAELRLRDVLQRFDVLPQDKDGLFELLEHAEAWLIRLAQKNTRNMLLDIVSQTKAVLISRDLLDHPDPDVKLVVTSCLVELIRITAPESPYDDDAMKVVFQRIVDTFPGLGDISSSSYERRASILDSFATVKCWNAMLDLGLDRLILNTFQHLLEAASANHSKKVTWGMKTILSGVIEESDDDIHPELASYLLQKLTKEAQGTLPASFRLAERVVGLCKEILKPIFVQLLRGTTMDNYSDAVVFICQNASTVVAENSLAAFGTNTAGGAKISERSVSGESPKETSKLEQDVNCTVEDGTRASITLTTAINNDVTLGGKNESPDSPASSKPKPELAFDGDNAKTEQLISGDKEVSEPVATETEKPVNVISNKSQEHDSSIGSEMTKQVKDVKDNESLVASEELSQEIAAGDNMQQIETGIKTADGSSKLADSAPTMIKKCGRPPKAKAQEKKPVRVKQGSDLKSGKIDPHCNMQQIETGIKTADGSSKLADSVLTIIKKCGRPPKAKSQEKNHVRVKQGSDLKSVKIEPHSYSGGRDTRRQTKNDTKYSPIKVAEGESVKQQKASLNPRKEDGLSNKDTDNDANLKEEESATKTDQTNEQQDSGVSKRKSPLEAEEAPISKKNKMLDENLVGSRIKVWWPLDKMFYSGVVESFSGSSKEHKVAYDDGDVETLLLHMERWEFITEEQCSDPGAASDMQLGRRGKGNSNLLMKGGNTGTPQSDGANPPKKRGRPKGVHSRKIMSNFTASSGKMKGKGAEKDTQETSKPGSYLKKEVARMTRSAAKTNDDIIKARNNSKDEVNSCEPVDGSKVVSHSTKRKLIETSEDKATAEASTRKKRGRKSCN